MQTFYVDAALLIFLVITAIAISRQKNLFATVILTGIYTLLCASLFICLDAVDVAFTEAAVGSGIATILLLSTLSQTGYEETVRHKISVPTLLLVASVGALLMFGLVDMPVFGLADTPVNLYLNERYIMISPDEIGVPNLVTAVLASYRGYDTLGEATVVFTAGVSVIVLIGRMTNKTQS